MDARILLVEDDPSIREVTAIGLRAAGFEVDTAPDGARGPGAVPARRARPRPARRDAPADGRARGLPRDPARIDRRPSSCSRRAATRSTSSSGSRPAPTTTSRSRSRCRSSSPASAPRSAAPGRRARPAAPPLMLGPLSIDLAGRTVARDGRDIPLTRTEFDLLLELPSDPARCSRATSCSTACGATTTSATRASSTSRSAALRAKIEEDPVDPAADPHRAGQRLQGRAPLTMAA